MVPIVAQSLDVAQCCTSLFTKNMFYAFRDVPRSLHSNYIDNRLGYLSKEPRREHPQTSRRLNSFVVILWQCHFRR